MALKNPTSGAALTQAAILAALSTDPVFEGMAEFTSLGTPGDYTLAKSGIVVKNGDGVEVFRIWGTDPDDNNYNSGNLYIGREAGLSQTTDNVDAGYYNVGVGGGALKSVTLGSENSALGSYALWSVIAGSENLAVGASALAYLVTGDRNTAAGCAAGIQITAGSLNTLVGCYAGSFFGGVHDQGHAVLAADQSVFLGMFSGAKADAQTNQIAIGYDAVGAGSNTAVIGNANITDAYFGSESAAANTHQKRVFIVGTTAPADGDLAANQCALWFDPTDGAAALMVKAKQANGTVKTGTLAVTT